MPISRASRSTYASRRSSKLWGVGAVESHNRTSNWSNGMSEFHRVLSSLSEITSKHANGSESEEEDGGDEVEERPANGGRKERTGDEGKSKKKDKKKNKEKEKKRKRKDEAAGSVEEASVVREKGEKKGRHTLAGSSVERTRRW